MKIVASIPVYNEQAILKNCLDHYSAWCDKIVMWDNGSTDNSSEIARSYPLVEVREFKTDAYDEMSVLNVLESSKADAIGHYDWIALPDADEIVAMRDGGSVRALLETSKAEVIKGNGYCFVQHPEEAPINLELPFIRQRKFGYPCYAYNKPILMRPEAPVMLTPGKHKISKLSECCEESEKNLVILHYEMADFEIYLYRKNRRPLSEENKRQGYSVQRFCRPVEEIEARFKAAIERARDLREEIPGIAGDSH